MLSVLREWSVWLTCTETWLEWCEMKYFWCNNIKDHLRYDMPTHYLSLGSQLGHFLWPVNWLGSEWKWCSSSTREAVFDKNDADNVSFGFRAQLCHLLMLLGLFGIQYGLHIPDEWFVSRMKALCMWFGIELSVSNINFKTCLVHPTFVAHTGNDRKYIYLPVNTVV